MRCRAAREGQREYYGGPQVAGGRGEGPRWREKEGNLGLKGTGALSGSHLRDEGPPSPRPRGEGSRSVTSGANTAENARELSLRDKTDPS